MPQKTKNPRLDSLIHLIGEVVGEKEEGSTKGRSRMKKTRVGYASLKVPPFETPAASIADRFASRGIMSPRVMAERLLRGVDLEADAHSVGLDPIQVAAIYQRALDSISPEVRASLEDAAKRPRPLGA